MQTLTATTLKNLYLLISTVHFQTPISPRTSITDQPPWQYPITGKIHFDYSKSAAQSLLEFSYRVAVHNREVNDGIKNPLALNPPGFDVVVPIDTTYMFMSVNVMWFFYSSSLNIVVLSATATYNNLLGMVDLNYPQVVPNITNTVPGMKIHGGFTSLYQDVQAKLLVLLNKYVNQDTQVLLTGLSLGGAVSSITALDLFQHRLDNGVVIENLVHYSFASPRLFNTIGAKAYNELGLDSYQIHNGSDIIPVVPLPIMPMSPISSETQDFMHVGKLIYFDRNLDTYYDNHITAYLNEYDVTPVA